MSLFELLKEIFRRPDSAYKELLAPGYFFSQRSKMNTEEYAKWLRKQLAEYSSMAYSRKFEGRQVPLDWITGICLIENEIDKIKTQGTSHLFPPDMKRVSDDFK